MSSPSAVVSARPVVAAGRSVALAVVVGLAVGALTAYAQGWLGDGVASLANSAGPWVLAAFIVARVPRWPWLGALLAAVTLALCEAGYALANSARGGANSTSTVAFWLAAAVIVGPFLGVGAVWSRHQTGARAGAGFGVVAGVLVGEGMHGVARISDTTDWRYWTVEIVLGVATVAAAWVLRRSRSTLLAAAAVAVVVAAILFVVEGAA